MRRKLGLKNGITLVIEDSPFAKGGEGELFKIIYPPRFKNQVLKLYHSKEKASHLEKKINFLINNPPNLKVHDGHHSVVWPIHAVYENNNFVGFTMPKSQGETLEKLCHIKLPRGFSNEWLKFDFNNKEAIEKRLKVCFNISVALNQIHTTNNYVLVDMKPDNIMIKSDGLVSIIDIDSVQVVKNGKVLFPSKVATPEYTPSEYYSNPNNVLKQESWDRFSMAIIFYRLLCGIHPFTGSCKPPFKGVNTTGEMIKNGLFANGSKKTYFKIVPPPHKKFEALSESVKSLFLRCFDKGFTNPNFRPSANDWCNILSPTKIIIDRDLPSEVYLLKNDNIVLKNSLPNGYFLTPKIKYINIKPIRGVSALLALIRKTKKQKLGDEIVVAQDSIDDLKKELENFKSKFNNISISFRNLNKQLVLHINKNFIKQETTYKREIAILDRKVKSLIEEERKKYIKISNELKFNLSIINSKVLNIKLNNLQPIENLFAEKQNALNNSLKKFHKRYEDKIKQINRELNNELSNLEDSVQAYLDDNIRIIDINRDKKIQLVISQKRRVENQEQVEKSELLEQSQELEIKHYLSKFSIRNDAHSIFNDQYANVTQILGNLSRAGIITAADFEAVNDSGLIKKSNGGWIKVSQVGGYRAERLGRWRSNKERNMPDVTQFSQDKELKKIENKYKPKYDEIDNKINEIKMEATQEKGKISKKAAEQERLMNKKKDKLKYESQRQIKQLKSSFDTKHLEIQYEIANLKSEYDKQIRLKNNQVKSKMMDLQNEEQVLRNKAKLDMEKIKVLYDNKHLPINNEAKLLLTNAKIQLKKFVEGVNIEMNQNHTVHLRQLQQVQNEVDNLKQEIRDRMKYLQKLQDKYTV